MVVHGPGDINLFQHTSDKNNCANSSPLSFANAVDSHLDKAPINSGHRHRRGCFRCSYKRQIIENLCMALNNRLSNRTEMLICFHGTWRAAQCLELVFLGKKFIGLFGIDAAEGNDVKTCFCN